MCWKRCMRSTIEDVVRNTRSVTTLACIRGFWNKWGGFFDMEWEGRGVELWKVFIKKVIICNHSLPDLHNNLRGSSSQEAYVSTARHVRAELLPVPAAIPVPQPAAILHHSCGLYYVSFINILYSYTPSCGVIILHQWEQSDAIITHIIFHTISTSLPSTFPYTFKFTLLDTCHSFLRMTCSYYAKLLLHYTPTTT